MEQSAKQPPSRETARVLQKETQGRKSEKREKEKTESLELRQGLDRKMKATSTTNLHKWKASRATTARRTTTRCQPTTPLDVSPGVYILENTPPPPPGGGINMA